MASIVNMQRGAQGQSVKNLQEMLKKNGYNLDVDGIFDSKTDAAVRDYQQKNGLAVDGIVGPKTWTTLNGTNKSSASGNTSAEIKAPAQPQFDTSKYTPGANVNTALTNKNNAENALANYGDFKYSNQATLDELINKILNREDFSYDLNGDALYQQYKDKHIQQGKMASADVMGQAAAMTGGYGNSYAQTVGNQAYQASLENLNDIVPELYQMAYDQYVQEGDDMYSQYSMLSDDRQTQYGEWADAYQRLFADRGYYADDYNNEYNRDYGMWSDTIDRNNSIAQQEYSNGYGAYQDALSYQQWEKEFAEAQRQYNDSKVKTVATKPNTTVKTQDEKTNVTDTGTGGYKTDTGNKTKVYNYGQAVDYMVANGVPNGTASGAMTESEWNRRKSSYQAHGTGGSEVKNYSSYEEYINDFVEYAIETYGK